MTIKCLLWDFGDTLCDERFIWGSGPEWMALYKTFDGGLGDDWSTHRLDTRAFAEKASAFLQVDPEQMIQHMVERCLHIQWFEFTYKFFKSRQLPQGIVTVNPDLFSEVIVPMHDLDEFADVIVTSWEEHNIDKSILCKLAIDRLPGHFKPEEALLIDNRMDNIDAWANVGGAGYHYTTDQQFQNDVATGKLTHARPG